MTENEMIKAVSDQYGYPEKVVRLAYRSMYKFIIDNIRGLDLGVYMTKEEFDKLKTNFMITDIGRLYCIWENIQKRKRFVTDVTKKKYRLARERKERERNENTK